jgi:hypothetical protein
MIRAGLNRSGSTLRANSIVGFGTPDNAGEFAINSLHTTGVRKFAGVIQRAVDDDGEVDVYLGGQLVVESDGTGVIAAGDEVIMVAGGSLGAGGRVARLPTSPTSGTNYYVGGRAITGAAAVAGTELTVEWAPYTFQGQ